MIRLTLEEKAGLSDVYDALRHIVAMGEKMKVDLLDAQVEAFPIALILEILQTLYNVKRSQRSQPPAICYVSASEVTIDNGTSHLIPTHAVTTFPSELKAAMDEIDATMVINILKKMARNATEPLVRLRPRIQAQALEIFAPKAQP